VLLSTVEGRTNVKITVDLVLAEHGEEPRLSTAAQNRCL